jgi:hypothetical protein
VAGFTADRAARSEFPLPPTCAGRNGWPIVPTRPIFLVALRALLSTLDLLSSSQKCCLHGKNQIGVFSKFGVLKCP